MLINDKFKLHKQLNSISKKGENHLENLGKKAKDKVTGFEGIIVGKCINPEEVTKETPGGFNRDCPI